MTIWVSWYNNLHYVVLARESLDWNGRAANGSHLIATDTLVP